MWDADLNQTTIIENKTQSVQSDQKYLGQGHLDANKFPTWGLEGVQTGRTRAKISQIPRNSRWHGVTRFDTV